MRIGILLAFVAASALRAGAPAEKTILGDWCAGSRNAFHQEFSLEIEDGERIFSSWLHQKPALHGTWLLEGKTLTIRGENGEVFEYLVVKATPKRLVLREEREKDPEVYVRHGKCLLFEDPYAAREDR